jgi:hypothetical protein
MGPLTLAAIGNLTTAVDNLTANLPVDSDDASDAALIDAQTARIEALTPAAPPSSTDGPVAFPAALTSSVAAPVVPGALPGQS